MKKIFAILLALTLVLSLVACGKGEAATEGGSQTGMGTAAQSSGQAESDVTEDFDLEGVVDYAKDVKTDGMTFYWVSKVAGGTYWTGVETGIAAAAGELGIKTTQMAVEKETDIDVQLNNLQNAVAANPDAILAAPCDSMALDKPLKEAKEAYGGPIVLIDTVISTSGGYDCAILTNNFNAGQAVCRLLIAGLVEKGYKEGTVGVECVNQGSQTVIDRMDGFKAYWEENAAAEGVDGIQVLWEELKVSEGDSNVAISSGQDLMTAHQDLVGMAGFNGDSVYFISSLKEAGNKDVIGVGMDFNVDSYDLMDQGWEYASVAQSTYNMGYYGTYLAVAVLAGQDFGGERIDSGLLEVTQDNLKSQEVQDYVNLLKSAAK
ncbi:MAG: substrate-binding domain-containing protein [Clostridia bacterium]|nr:substrate-binding domain-containing protein [Clostridia bacterium]